jgi:LigD, primase-polymerase domain/ATP dependent DNA ligase domain
LQAALGDGGRPERIVAYVFDLLHLDGENLTKLPLTERKKKLDELLKKSKLGASIRYSEHVAVEGAEIHAQACAKGLEGIISKLASAPYVAGRQKSWLKLAAQDVRQRLKQRGLESSLKCSGGKGLHVTVALAGKDKWPQVKQFAGDFADEMVAAVPDAYVATMTKSKRMGKIFIDYFRNDYTATAIADYGVRARPGAPVAVPLSWDELRRLKSANAFTIKDVLKRLKNRKPPVPPKGQVLPG